MKSPSLPTDWRFHHVGIAVWDIEAARDIYAQLGFSCGDILQHPALNVKLVFCHGAGTLVELVAPVSESSPCMFYLKRIGPGAYHTCYQCDDIGQSLEQLKRLNLKYKVVARPDMPSDQSRLVFLFLPACGLIELIEAKKHSQNST